MSIRCRGCWQLGNNCGQCDQCVATADQGVAEICRCHDEINTLRQQVLHLDDERRKDKVGHVRDLAPLQEYRREYPKVKLRVAIAEAEARGLREALGAALAQISELEARLR